MNIKQLSVAALVLLLVTGVYADKELKVMKEFNQVQDYTLNPVPSNEQRKKNLEHNLASAIKHALVKEMEPKKFSEQTKDITLAKLQFNRKPGTYSYYVKFDKYIVFCKFAANPELNKQLPILETAYTNPGEEELKRAEKARKEGKDIVFEGTDDAGGSSDSAPASDASGSNP
ncbi:MAG: hypothetical protein AAF518_23160 [Spirochaetota bacterium]